MEQQEIQFGVGVLGFGTVGAGVVQGLSQNQTLIRQRTGLTLNLRGVADLDIETDRGVEIDPSILTTDAQALIDDPEIQILVELIGGEGIARELILKALRAGKDVVTANKALLAKHGAELYQTAAESGSDLFYEAAVGGGIPVVKAFREGLVANHIVSVYGILNGTCNYILTRMEEEKAPLEEILADAQRLGFAEAEPSLDVDGWDTAHKAAILGSLAYGFPVPMDQMLVEGIMGLQPYDIEMAESLGYRIKLLAVIKPSEEGADVRVHPALIPEDHLLASVHGVFNAVLVDGDIVGETLYYGKGAGREATSSAVISDIVDVARNRASSGAGRLPPLVSYRKSGAVRSMDLLETRYYVRMNLMDKPGSLAMVSGILAEYGIGIASLIQREENRGEYVPVIFLTTRSLEKNMNQALEKIEGLQIVSGSPTRIRIEDLDPAEA